MGLWVKGLIALAVVAFIAVGVVSYNKAIAKSERLEAENQTLTESVVKAEKATQDMKAEKELAEKLASNQETETKVIHDTQIKTIEVIKTVQGECLDVRAPAAIVDRLRQ